MAGIKLPPEDSASQSRPTATSDLISDDDRSVAADSWSIKSDYGSTLDDEQRHADASEALAAVNLRAASDYSSDKEDKEDPDSDGVQSLLGYQSYWDSQYANELANFREHGHSGEVWFGVDVMETVASWTKGLCSEYSRAYSLNHVENSNNDANRQLEKELSHLSVLDIGTGNGLLLQEFAKQGFSDLTGTDYSEGAIDLARSIAIREGLTNVKFMVDDILETKIDRNFQIVLDKGTLDAVGLHPDGVTKRIMYWDSVSKLVAPDGILVITSCNSTKEDLMSEVDQYNERRCHPSQDNDPQVRRTSPVFYYVDHIRSYPTFMFGGVVGSRVATVAFQRSST